MPPTHRVGGIILVLDKPCGACQTVYYDRPSIEREFIMCRKADHSAKVRLTMRGRGVFVVVWFGAAWYAADILPFWWI